MYEGPLTLPTNNSTGNVSSFSEYITGEPDKKGVLKISLDPIKSQKLIANIETIGTEDFWKEEPNIHKPNEIAKSNAYRLLSYLKQNLPDRISAYDEEITFYYDREEEKYRVISIFNDGTYVYYHRKGKGEFVEEFDNIDSLIDQINNT